MRAIRTDVTLGEPVTAEAMDARQLGVDTCRKPVVRVRGHGARCRWGVVAA